MPRFRIAACAALAASACVAPDPEKVSSVDVSLSESCPKPACGDSGNSPVIDGVYFWSLHSYGMTNAKRIRMDSASHGATALRMVVGPPGDQLYGVDPDTGIVLVNPEDLEGTRIIVTHEDPVTHEKIPFQIRIGHVSTSVDFDWFWVAPGAWVRTYEFFFAPISNLHDERPLCSLANPDDPGDPMIRAIVFKDDVYNPDTKLITTGPTTFGWFNVACHGGAPYKMHMMGHTSVAQSRLGIVTSPAKRQALLNAWTMNACGTGRAFTNPGEPIKILEAPNLLPWSSEYMTAPWVSVEAVWGPEGAQCLTTPRLFPKVPTALNDILLGCGGKLPPPCAGFPIFPLGDRILTHNPDN
jgi:hypothetical protein